MNSQIKDIMEVDTEKIDIDVPFYLKKTNYQGRIQVLIMMTQCLFSLAFGMTLFSIPYIFYQPNFECLNKLGEYESCTEAQACSSNSEYKIYSDVKSLVLNFDLVCERKTEVDNIQFLTLVSSGLITGLVFLFADNFGRKNTLLLSGICLITGNISSISSSDLLIITVGMMLSSIGILINIY